ncbi:MULTISPECIES: valine--tRNA ligase [Wolbachia]|nr:MULTISPECIES: valine--tRNA ligase [Wolbachia]UYC23825.1 valine--tRNA ligase [Wolbachia endosymbiont of Aedes aegypti]QBB83908.1 valine--tRNA ligase [Wolbachia pipientis wAlbB]QDW08710.1 valine--tRNA ligase [Wolbachia pipientis]QDW09904.1 valine--tRNA ligase [Wolbachia pipientis]QZA82981.1 valine--tRNA ligase [Wolbachia pipientis]
MLEEKYSFREIENKYNILWEGSKVYKWSSEKGNTFTIDTPPPTISGKLHIGHIFSYCHTDFIARFQRMLGKDVFYPIGFDDNGLPTERLVEQTYRTRAKEVGREKFIEMCHEVIEKSKQEFKELFKSVGISYDWSLEYHTISKEAVALSQMSFVDLYNKGYAYRKMQPILWDPVDKTAIAQAEIEDKVFESSLNTIVFATEENEQIKIATTRPELLPACVAVFCHPEDERYTQLIGKIAIVAITGARVPIIADDKVKIDKGTGLVMCCTFGDELDIYWQQKHGLPMKIIIDQDGRISLDSVYGNNRSQCQGTGMTKGSDIPVLDTGIQPLEETHAPARDAGIYDEINGLKVKEARKKIIEILTEKGLLIESTNISHSVKCAERSGAPLEILPTYQWFIKTLEQKTQVLDKVRECSWHPESMRKRMEVWVEGLSWDWCISRQRYFGVPFPVWHSKRKGEEGKIILAEVKDLPIDPLKDLPKGYSKEEIIPDQDVMDTWATSAITPQLSALAVNSELGLPSHRYDKIFPADLRSQSHEIIRTWAFYTILKAHYHADSLPWKNIMISGWCLADDKKKMSKSKGNIITPHVMLETYGADVVRYWAANSRLGVDTVYSENIFKIGKRLVTKLWNASKFVSMFMERHQGLSINSISETMDKWILSKLYKVIEKTTNNLLQFEYCEALSAIEEFFWKDFCDNYLELVKKRAYGDALDSEANMSAKQSLAYVLNIILRLFAPFLPYITEEIYHQLYSYNSVHNKSNWPNKEELIYDKYSEEMGDNFVQILNLVRKIKADNNVSVKHLIQKLMIKASVKEDELNYSAQHDLQSVCNAEVIEWVESTEAELITENGKFTVSLLIDVT